MTNFQKNMVCLAILALAILVAKRDGLVLPILQQPTAEKLWILAIDDFATRTPMQTNVLRSGDYWDTVRARGHKFEAYEKPSPDAARYAAVSRYPDELVFQDAATGKVLGVEVIPADVTPLYVDTLIQKYTGAAQ